MEMLTDNPITGINDDKFHFKPYARILADTIQDTTRLPFSIGIFGAWGTGKTSLMKMIENYVCNNNTKTIWFNPWKYDQKEDLWHALIQTILYRIADEHKEDALGSYALDLAKHTTWFLLKKGISTVTNNFISENSIENIKTAISSQDKLHYKHINEFEVDFSSVVEQYTDHGKLIIFIDDLDRCIPENAITVLESLKLFIGHAKCVFVLGMDHYIVEQGIKHRYTDKIEMSGRDYLDKMIQVPFFLPPVPFQRLRDAFSVFKTTNYNDEIWKLVNLGFSGNPRKTKRFINCYYLINEIIGLPERYDDINYQDINFNVDINTNLQRYYLGKLLVLQMEFTYFYDFLLVNPDGWQQYETRLLNVNGYNEIEGFINTNKDT
jgi:hypothetical protein